MQENNALNAVLKDYDAEACKSLDNMDRVHCFWRCTTVTQDDFRKLLCKLLNSDVINIYNDFTPDFIRKVLNDFVKYAMQTNGIEKNQDSDAQKSWRKVCQAIAEHNIADFLARENNLDEDERLIEQFAADLEPFFRDEELAVYLLLNFARAIARNELVQFPVQEVNFKRGITLRIWKNAAGKYFPKECVV